MRGVRFEPGHVVVEVRSRRRRLRCPLCGLSTRFRYDRLDTDSRWRHLDLGAFEFEVRARLRRLACPTHGVRTECVPFARAGSASTADLAQAALALVMLACGPITLRLPHEIDPHPV